MLITFILNKSIPYHGQSCHWMYTINCQVSENRRLRDEGDGDPLSPQQCGEANSPRSFREETLGPTCGKDKSASPELFGKRTPDMGVGSNGRESSARTMAVVA